MAGAQEAVQGQAITLNSVIGQIQATIGRLENRLAQSEDGVACCARRGRAGGDRSDSDEDMGCPRPGQDLMSKAFFEPVAFTKTSGPFRG